MASFAISQATFDKQVEELIASSEALVFQIRALLPNWVASSFQQQSQLLADITQCLNPKVPDFSNLLRLIGLAKANYDAIVSLSPNLSFVSLLYRGFPLKSFGF